MEELKDKVVQLKKDFNKKYENLKAGKK